MCVLVWEDGAKEFIDFVYADVQYVSVCMQVDHGRVSQHTVSHLHSAHVT